MTLERERVVFPERLDPVRKLRLVGGLELLREKVMPLLIRTVLLKVMSLWKVIVAEPVVVKGVAELKTAGLIKVTLPTLIKLRVLVTV